MDEILGTAKNREDSKKDECSGVAGLVILDDAFMKLTSNDPLRMQIAHNTIDRFSGGVINKRLFTEQVLYGGEFTLEVMVLGGRWKEKKKDVSASAESTSEEIIWQPVADKYWQALEKALEDLCEGRLALGANGHGYCELVEGTKPALLAEFGGANDRTAS
jgi:hypothetical protein